MPTRRLASLPILFVLLSCSAPEPDPPEAVAADTDAVAAQATPPAPPPEFSFESQAAVDLTGDLLPDTLRLSASGSGPMEIPISFSISSAGRQVYSSSWVSHVYFTYEPDLAMTANDSTLYAWVRDGLETVLDSSSFTTLAARATTAHPDGRVDPETHPIRLISGQLLMPFLVDSLTAAGVDSAAVRRTAGRMAYSRDRIHPDAPTLWGSMSSEPLTTFTLNSGGEMIERLAWSDVADRFFMIWGCC